MENENGQQEQEKEQAKPVAELALVPLALVKQLRAYLGGKPLPYDETAGMIRSLEAARVVTAHPINPEPQAEDETSD